MATDPELKRYSADRSVRPVVVSTRAGVQTWAIAVIVILVAAILFIILDARRQAVSSPSIASPPSEAGINTAPPPLYVPVEPEANDAPVNLQAAPAQPASAQPFSPPTPRQPPQQTMFVPSANSSIPMGSPLTPPASPSTRGVNAAPTIVYDAPAAAGASGESRASGGNTPTSAPNATDRAQAAIFANPSTTVAQGTIIPAVLETAFDSSKPGFARALVQRDIRSFDGSRVLIPRGSRLFGEYQSAASQGQKRALISWTRLIRPDGITIAIASPSADPVGRGGIKAKVNSHFFERFSGAILQSGLNMGANLAARSSGSPVVVAIPGAMTGVSSTIQPTQIPPTLTVARATSISVLVARDLDFSTTDQQR